MRGTRKKTPPTYVLKLRGMIAYTFAVLFVGASIGGITAIASMHKAIVVQRANDIMGVVK